MTEANHLKCAVTAQLLKNAIADRDLAGAYRVFRGLSADDASTVALMAGLSVVSTRNKTQFFLKIQESVSKAVRGA